MQARLHVADDAAAAGLQSLAHLMARVQRAAAHADRQGDTSLHTLRTHESDVSFPLPSSLTPPPLPRQTPPYFVPHAGRQGNTGLHTLRTHESNV